MQFRIIEPVKHRLGSASLTRKAARHVAHVPFLFYFVPVAQSLSPLRQADVDETFQHVFREALPRPLTEIAPASPGDGAAALGFALGWIAAAPPKINPAKANLAEAKQAEHLTLIAAPDSVYGETGVMYAPGVAQFGLSATRLLHVRTRTLKEALWASEQTLSLQGARVLCLVPQDARLTLTATRRLHLAAEKSGARCVLLRFDPLAPSAAWTRWSVAAAASQSFADEMGKPCFAVSLLRRRSGQSGRRWLLEWNAHEHVFNEASRIRVAPRLPMVGRVVAASPDRPAEAHWRRAG